MNDVALCAEVLSSNLSSENCNFLELKIYFILSFVYLRKKEKKEEGQLLFLNKEEKTRLDMLLN